MITSPAPTPWMIDSRSPRIMAAKLIVNTGSAFSSIEVLTGPTISRPTKKATYATVSATPDPPALSSASGVTVPLGPPINIRN